jgi:predicted nucleotidyltransferase
VKTPGKRPPQITGERLQAAVQLCIASGAEVDYLFGSQPRGRAWAESDVDLAVLLGPSVPKEQYGPVRAQLISELMSIFGSNDVDVAILNRASPLLTYAGVIQGGRLLFEKDRLARIHFEVRVFQQYVDTVPLRETQNHYLKEAIRKRAVAFDLEPRQ